jgi:phage terminase large subunit GpA-like protein
VGWFIQTQKAPMMVVQPTLDMAELWSKQRLAPMIEDCPTLKRIVRPARERDSGNTTLLKEFPGGVLYITGANSGAGLRSMPAQYLLLDEVDAYPIEIDKEGDPVELAEGRTTTFPRSKVFVLSTPTIESLSRIHKEYEASDQRHFYVPCPHCEHFQILAWENLNWPEGRPREAKYICEDCGTLIEEYHKTQMLARGEWRATFHDRDVVGFHINALYTPLGLGKSWSALAEQFEKSEKDPIKIKTFINLRLGEVTKDPNDKFDAEELSERAESRPIRSIPDGCLLLTAGIDVQKDRFAMTILGWGRRGTMCILDWCELPADPTNPDDWFPLEHRVLEPIVNAYGVPMRVEMAAVDSGYLQDDVIHFTRPRQRRGWIAVKGATTANKPIISRASKIDYTWRGHTIKSGAEQWPVGGFHAKEWLFTRLAADRERAIDQRLIRFPSGLGSIFYEQLTAEVFDPVRRRFVKIRERNEALDTVCYALAAAWHPLLRVQTWQEPRWAEREKMFQPEPDLFSNLPSQVPQATIEDASVDAAPVSFSLARERRQQLLDRFRESIHDE